MRLMKGREKAVLVALAVALLFLGGGGLYKTKIPPQATEFDISGKPSLGDGPIKLVLFEDMLCKNCRIFTENVFPHIVSKYLEPGKAEMAFIPVAFTEHSKMFANAAISVYNLAPSRFVPFILNLSHSRASSKEDVLGIAASVGGISLTGLKKSLDGDRYYLEIDQNLVWAKSMIGPEFGTPMLFVNGIRTSTRSFDALERQIHQLEER